jgi:nitroimidazol reductase NimA-like FMN-containing flavoprotein (pyridoxamine 5'-phosphate oxidase superfamily)
MRRKDKEITQKVVKEEILRQTYVGRLGLVINENPYIVPMNFCYSQGVIYLHSHKDGLKIQELRKSPQVCFEVDEGEMITGENPCDYSWEYTSVIAYGKASIIKDKDERLKALRLLSDKYSPGKGRLITKELIAKFDHLSLVKIEVDEMTGKKSPA